MPGEIHAFLGENGAGQINSCQNDLWRLATNFRAIPMEGRQFPSQTRRWHGILGIGMVFQHFSLFEALTVAENIALAMPGPFDLGQLSERISKVSAAYGLAVSPSSVVGDLSVGERQRIEIVRCLLQEPKLLIMDEPTSVLTPQEADQLFVVLKRLARRGLCCDLHQPSPRGGERTVSCGHHLAPWQGCGRRRSHRPKLQPASRA